VLEHGFDVTSWNRRWQCGHHMASAQKCKTPPGLAGYFPVLA
jgi:hypothetical protein